MGVAACVGGCHAILGLDDPIVDGDTSNRTLPEGGDEPAVIGPAIDGGNRDADAGSEDAAEDAAEPPFTVEHRVNWDNPLFWNKVDLKNLNTGTTTFVGAVFDGRYVYFAPSNNVDTEPTFAARYDTLGGGLTVPQAWQFYDTSLLSGEARGFEGAFFDGRYVTFVPFAGTSGHVGVFARFDTKSGRAFTDNAAWSTFDTRTLNENAKGYVGAVFDGTKYAYVVPGFGSFANGLRPQSIAARLDTTNSDWKTSAAWTLFDTQTIAPTLDGGGPRGFCGGVNTGKHVYFVPYGYSGGRRGRAVRYDLSKNYVQPESWEMFDLADLNPAAIGFQGGGFDGRYVYYAGFDDGTGSTMARYDTTKAFTSGSSWSIFDVGTVDGGLSASQADASPVVRGGYVGMGFDGRFMYFAPSVYSAAHHGWLARFDSTKSSFDDPSAWSFYDLSKIDPKARGMCGAVFDARYLYLVPCFTSLIVRFDTLEPISGTPRLPKLPHAGSFL